MFTEATLSSFGQDASCHFTPWEEGFSDTKLPFRGARFCWARETAPQKQRRVLLGGFVTSDLSILGSPLPSLGGLAWRRLEVAASVGGLGPHPLPTPLCKGVHPPLPPRVCCREGAVSTKQVVFLQRPCLPQKVKKKESKVSDLGALLGLAPRSPGDP